VHYCVIWGYFKAKSVIDNVQKSFKGLDDKLKKNSVVIIVAAIAALVSAFIYLWNNCEGFRNFWINLWEGIKEFFSNAIETIKSIFERNWRMVFRKI